MSAGLETRLGKAEDRLCEFSCSEDLQREFHHIAHDWWWLFSFGILLMVCGVVSLLFPIVTSLAVVSVLGIALMVAGIATIVTSAWAGKWSGMAVQLLVGIVYAVIGFMLTDMPVASAAEITLFLASFCIVLGVFRMVSSLLLRYPCWGWSLLNGVVTLLLGMIIYRNFPHGAIWMLGTLIGIELLFNGWMWTILALAVRRIPGHMEAH